MEVPLVASPPISLSEALARRTVPAIALSTPAVFFIFLAAILVLGVCIRVLFYRSRRREEMQAMAERVGLHPALPNVPPNGLPLYQTVFHDWSRLSNVYQGSLNGREVVVLDFFKKAGRATWSRTIIGAKTTEHIHKPYDFELQVVGAWQIVYEPVPFFRTAKLMDIDQIEIILRGIARR